MNEGPPRESDWSKRDRRRIRLPRETYALEGSTWHVTLATRQGISPLFEERALRSRMVEVIDERCGIRGCVLHLSCVMPDHVHLLLEVGKDDLIAVIGDVKSCVAREWWGFGGERSPWQRRFYDRGVRTSRQFEEVVRYILGNPVESGLCEDWEEYPYFSGVLLRSGDP
ncbi:MAG: transposase [Thermomicrobiales bacterium]